MRNKVVRYLASLPGGTPLHWAAMKGNLELCRVLVAAGADVRARNAQGRTPLEHARWWLGGGQRGVEMTALEDVLMARKYT